MKIILNENKIIKPNPDLLNFVLHQYKTWFQSYCHVLYNEIPKTPNQEIKALVDKGGQNYIKEIQEDGRHKYIGTFPIKNILNYDLDPILKRRMTRKQFISALKKEPRFSLTFWVRGDNDGALGLFTEFNEATGLENLISIAFPYVIINNGGIPYTFFKIQWPKIEETIRHELQHFTQSFYAKLFNLNHWIGTPTKKGIKGVPQFGHSDAEHQDIPIEVSTDVQDEINEFIRWIKDEFDKDYFLNNPKILKNLTLNFLGFVDRGHYTFLKNDTFEHYLQTNKDIWKWAVNKLLYSISRM